MRIVKDNPIVSFRQFFKTLGDNSLEWRGAIICFQNEAAENEKLRTSMLMDAVVKSYGDAHGQLYAFSDDIFILLTHKTTLEQYEFMHERLSSIFKESDLQIDFYDFSMNVDPFIQTAEIFAEEFAEKHIQIAKAKALVAEKVVEYLDYSPIEKMASPQEIGIAKRLRSMRFQPTIMIVDDDSYILKLLSGILRGFNLVQAASAQEAIHVYSSVYPDIVFLDIGLESFNGIEILEEITKRDKDSYIVMLTAKKDMTTVQEAISKGATGYIAKPFSSKKVLKYIEMKVKG